MIKVEPVTLVYAKLENRPGTLEHATRLLAKRKLNIESISLETVGSAGFVRIQVHRPEDALAALREGGIEAHPSDALLTTLPNKPGELGKVAGEFAAAGLNVESVLTTTDQRLVIRTSDNERALEILKKL